MTLRPIILAVAGGVLLAGCAGAAPMAIAPPAPLNPLDQFAVQVAPAADEIQLAPHGGLSPGQDSALAALAMRWREVGEGAIVIQATAGASAGDTAQAAMSALHGYGVPTTALRLTTLAGEVQGPVKVGFKRYVAVGPQCANLWGDLVRTAGNAPSSTFGCTTTANFAAQIADPRDLVAPQPMQPADARRRVSKQNSYTAGEEPVEGGGAK